MPLAAFGASRELMDAMPPKGRSVAHLRYILGCSWPETATVLDTSVNTAQKELSYGIKNAFGTSMRELQRKGYKEIADPKRKKERNSLCRQIKASRCRQKKLDRRHLKRRAVWRESARGFVGIRQPQSLRARLIREYLRSLISS